MPLVGGKELLLFLKAQQRYKSIPVMLYSLSVDEQEREKFLRNGAADYIIKPILFEEYVSLTGSVICKMDQDHSAMDLSSVYYS